MAIADPVVTVLDPFPQAAVKVFSVPGVPIPGLGLTLFEVIVTLLRVMVPL
jgi:hypothetical protein